MNRIRSLDGLRAISIGLVLLTHLAGTRGFFSMSAVAHFGDLGNLGVRVFFVISGFVITRLLIAEWERTNNISLRAFDRTFAVDVVHTGEFFWGPARPVDVNSAPVGVD